MGFEIGLVTFDELVLEESCEITIANRNQVFNTSSGGFYYVERDPYQTLSLTVTCKTDGANQKSTFESWYLSNQETFGNLTITSDIFGGFAKCYWNRGAVGYRSRILPGHAEHWEMTFNVVILDPLSGAGLPSLSDYGADVAEFGYDASEVICKPKSGYDRLAVYGPNRGIFTFNIPQMTKTAMLDAIGYIGGNFNQEISIAVPQVGTATGKLVSNEVVFKWPDDQGSLFWSCGEIMLTDVVIT